MNFDRALRRYANDRFSDRDVTHSSGLSLRAWRELIRLRVVRTVTDDRGRGVRRLCDATTLKRAAVIGALNRAGFSLAVSGQVAYFMPYHSLLYEICDPGWFLLHRSLGADFEAGLPPKVERPEVDWFDPAKPAVADPESDWQIEICDGRFVAAIYPKGERIVFGDLRKDGARFVAWFPIRQRPVWMGNAIEASRKESAPRILDFIAEWETPTPWKKELSAIDYVYENHEREDDPLRLTAERASRSSIFKSTINVTLAVRTALRRYLGIEPRESLRTGNR